MRRVVVTGLGIVAPTGNNIPTAWENALAAKSAVAKITLFDTKDFPTQIAAEVKGFDPASALDAKTVNRATRFVQFAAGAAKEAIHDAGLVNFDHPERFGCSIGVGLGAIESLEENTMTLNARGYRRISPFFIPYTIPNMAAGQVSINHNLKGPNICTTTACTSGTHGIGEAYLYISMGMADAMVAGGAEAAISPLGVVGFIAAKALSTNNADPTRASRPFDKERDGFVMGEGAGVLVLEEMEHAKKRGAKIYAEMVGYGMSADAHHITAPAPEGEGAVRCMEMTLASGKIPRDQIDYINAHGTSTELNDMNETKAIHRVFGEYAKSVAISSTKGVTGHCLGAAGGIEAVYTVLALKNHLVPPTANYSTPDPECYLDYTPNKAKEKRLRYAMSNSFGFGGTNGCIAFKAFS